MIVPTALRRARPAARSVRTEALLLVLSLLAATTVVSFVQAGTADAVTFTVTSSGHQKDIDDKDGLCDIGNGRCTLRAALREAKLQPGPHRIEFAIPANDPGHAGGVWTITANAAFESVDRTTVIDGRTQPGWVAGGPPVIVVDGTGTGGTGLHLKGAGSELRGIAIGGFAGEGVRVDADDVVITDTWLGLHPDGTTLLPFGTEVIKVNDKDRAVIGEPGAGNVIVGGRNGVWVRGDDVTIQGNVIGMDPTGTVAMGAKDAGIRLDGGVGGLIGGTGDGEGNLIASGGWDARREIMVQKGSADIIGNRIGLAPDGTDVSTAGNAIFINEASARFEISDNVIGGAQAAGLVLDDNHFDVAFRRNRILDNGGIGIDLVGGTEDAAGVTANDPGDLDAGSNGRMNHPVSIVALNETITFDLDVVAGSYLVDVFANPSGGDPSGHGEGEVYVDTFEITHTGSGLESFLLTDVFGIIDQRSVSLTVTSCAAPGCDDPVATSEFSPDVVATVETRLVGTVYEDVDGDGAVSDDGVGLADVGVWAFRDGGDGVPSPDDTVAGTTTTGPDGRWQIAVGDGTYFVAVGTEAITPTAGLNGGATQDDVRPDQTYAGKGAASLDGGSWSFTTGAGRFHGGRDTATIDGFPVLTAAQHVLRATVAGSSVARLDMGFSFAAVTSTLDDPPAGGAFTDLADWEVFSAADAGLGAVAEGYDHQVFDGRYVYFAPSANDLESRHGGVLRHDTTGAFDDVASWSVFDPGAAGVGVDPDGYVGAAFDGRYVYLAPEDNGSGPHGEVLRYDTTAPFAAAASWRTFDPGAAAGWTGGAADDYAGVGFDGRYLYLAPASHDAPLRYDTTGSFTDVASWTEFDLGDNTALVDPAFGFSEVVVTPDEVVFVPLGAGDLTGELVVRYDRDGPFTDPAAWEGFELNANGVRTTQTGFGAAVFDGRHLYMFPRDGDNGEVVRWDTDGPFGVATSWASYDLRAQFGDAATNFRTATFDGRFVYAGNAAHRNGTAQGQHARFDTLGSFTSAASWTVFDPGAAGFDAAGFDPDGILGSSFDGRYVYLSIGHDGTDASGEVLRYDTGGATQGTLRQVIENANAIVGPHGGWFGIPTDDVGHVGGAWTIRPSTDLPAITEAMTLDATTQAGWDGTPVVALDGNGTLQDGISVTGSDVTLRGLAFVAWQNDGVVLAGADRAVVAASWFGLRPVTGAAAPIADDAVQVEGGGVDQRVGGDGADGNRIEGNGSNGVEVTGSATRVAVVGNAISGNAELGIDLGGAGVTPNDPGDGDTGPNALLNTPEPIIVAGGRIELSLDAPSDHYRIDVFRNPSGADPTGYGEAEQVLGSFVVDHTAGAIREHVGTVGGIGAGDLLSFTATACADGASCTTFEHTSELSAVVVARAAMSGTVYEDVDGDGDVTDDGVGVPGVRVLVLGDDGDGVPDAGDRPVGGAATAADGSWSVLAEGDGTYWVLVDSATVAPSAGLDGGATPQDVWAEQTWAAAGALVADGTTSFTTTAGALFGGATAGVSDLFPTAAGAQHVLRAVVAGGTDVTGLDTGFSFATVTASGDDSGTAFDDDASWTAFDPGANGVGVDPDGYWGAVSDGRYLYYAPSHNGTDRFGEVMRLDTTAAFGSAAAWTAFDPGANGVGVDPDGYAQPAFDGRYVYFAPYHNGTAFHGEVLRYDTTRPFAAASSWTTFDPGAAGVGTVADGYGGALFDGRYVYLVPYRDGVGEHGEVMRYDTTRSFTTASSWVAYDPGANGVGTDPDGYAGAVLAGRYVYFVPQDNGSGVHGEVLRLDRERDFTSTSAWATYDHGLGDGYWGAAFDGRYLYLAPDRAAGGTYDGDVVRYDTEGVFADPGSWSSFDAGDAGVGIDPDGYRDVAFDGRYMIFAPYERSTGFHAEVLRYDTRLPFTDGASWSTFTPGVTTQVGGYQGITVVGDTAYLVPRLGASGAHGEFLAVRLDRLGQGQLRTTVDNAAAVVGAATARFALTPADAAYDGTGWRLDLAAPLTITSPLVLDATTQPGWTADPVVTLGAGMLAAGVPGITLAGAGAGIDGLAVADAPGTGVVVDGDGTSVLRSWVGLDHLGGAAGPGGAGIRVQGTATGVALGTAGAGNRVRWASGNGIEVVDTATGVTVVGSRITTVGGNGVDVTADDGTVVVQHTTVQDAAGAGVRVVGTSTTAVVDNVIVGNGGLGIDLGGDGVTPNDVDDLDVGPNGLLNHPTVVLSVDDVGATLATLTADLEPGDHRIDVFTNPSGADPVAGEGETLVGTLYVTTATGDVATTVPLPTVGVGDEITLTATLLDALGDPVRTSEFSAAVTVLGVGDVASVPDERDASPGREDGRTLGDMDAADLVAGATGEGLELDGVDDRIVLWTPGTAGGNLTVTAWVDPDGDGTIMARGTAWRIERDAGRLAAAVDLGGGAVTLTGPALPAGTWAHVGLVLGGGTARLYHDGVLVDSAAVAGQLTRDASVRTWIGGRGTDGTTDPFDGTVDEVRLRGAALAANRIATEAALGAPGGATTVGAEQQRTGGRWTVDPTTGRTGSRALLAPTDITAAWLTLDGLDEPGLEVRSWWLLAGSPLDIGVGVRAVPPAAGPVQDEVTLRPGGWGLSRWDVTSTILAPSPPGQSPGGSWQLVTVRTDQDGTLGGEADGVDLGQATGPGVRPSGTLGFRSGLLTGTDRWWIDDLLVRRYVSPEPTTRLGPLVDQP